MMKPPHNNRMPNMVKKVKRKRAKATTLYMLVGSYNNRLSRILSLSSPVAVGSVNRVDVAGVGVQGSHA